MILCTIVLSVLSSLTSSCDNCTVVHFSSSLFSSKIHKQCETIFCHNCLLKNSFSLNIISPCVNKCIQKCVTPIQSAHVVVWTFAATGYNQMYCMSPSISYRGSDSTVHCPYCEDDQYTPLGRQGGNKRMGESKKGKTKDEEYYL